jgi:hypothetical protein
LPYGISGCTQGDLAHPIYRSADRSWVGSITEFGPSPLQDVLRVFLGTRVEDIASLGERLRELVHHVRIPFDVDAGNHVRLRRCVLRHGTGRAVLCDRTRGADVAEVVHD